MISAQITLDNEALVYLKLIGNTGIQADIPFIIDTGFSGFLSLPQSWMDALGYPVNGSDRVTLADGSHIEVNLHDGKVVWDGQTKDVLIHCLGGDALIGMSIMSEYLLHLPIRISSTGTLTALP